MKNTVSLTFPTLQHTKAFAQWVEQHELDFFFESSECGQADRETGQEPFLLQQTSDNDETHIKFNITCQEA